MKPRKITGLLIGTMLVGIAQGATIRYRQSGEVAFPSDDHPQAGFSG